MTFVLDRNELAPEFKTRIAIARTEDLVPLVGPMRKKVHFAAQLPFLLEELARRGHPVLETEVDDPHGMARAFLIIIVGLAVMMLFFDGHLWLRDMISGDFAKLMNAVGT